MTQQPAPQPDPWRCVNCGSPSAQTERTCECPTDLLYKRNDPGGRIIAKDAPPDPLLDFAHDIMSTFDRETNEYRLAEFYERNHR